MTRANNIVRIKNFLTSVQLKEFQDFFKSEPIFIDKNITSRSMVTLNTDHYIFDSSVQYVEKICEAVSDFFGVDVSDFSGTCFRKWYPGEFQPPHSDCEAKIYFHEDEIVCDPFYNFSSLFLEYGSLCYLNEDYEGGEIYFPQYSISIKPSVNEFIFFPGTDYYMHGVSAVSSGNRLVVQNFLTTNKLLYLWKKFIQGKEKLRFINYSQEEMMGVKRSFDRSNLPDNCPHRLRD